VAASSTRRERRRLRAPDALIVAAGAVSDEIDSIVCGDEK
jgi:hypothetical protein